ncbi:MAG TPA: sigma-70 family RNA polymerase sigma factor [Verrucomicrobiae bacterium]|nr:sigma-70 family RNA polymerase sigma factor [Verrucomicrobiae bacterium]
MNAKSDVQLLREYAARGYEAAFAEIVRRHLALVYSAALRQVESPTAAVDIAQSVFVDLARKAASVSEKFSTDASLLGWLHRSARYAALNHLRDTRRRLTNERQAMEQLLVNSESEADWEQIRPALDEALDNLADDDREILLLRYFENKNLREVGEQLNISDDAAQKRVSRAVEKLGEFFSKRNITIGASGLTVLISANAVQSAPMELAMTISTAAALTGTTISTSTAIATTKVIAMTTLQKSIIGAAFVAAVGTGIFEAHQNFQLQNQIQTFQQQQASLTDQIQQLQHEHNNMTNQLADLLAENAQLKSGSNENELLRLRAKSTRLDELANENNNLKMKVSELEGRWFNVTNAPQYSGPYFPRGKWEIYGNGDPLEILLSAATAAINDDQAKLSALISNTNNLSLFSKKRWDTVKGIQSLKVSYINNNGKETAIEDTILMRQVVTGEQIDPNQPPALTDLMQTAPESHRWYFSKTEDGWKITGGD